MSAEPVRQVNYRRVNGVAPKACAYCGDPMDPSVAWWWTWHGATCSEPCAARQIRRNHSDKPLDPAPCTRDCREPQPNECRGGAS